MSLFFNGLSSIELRVYAPDRRTYYDRLRCVSAILVNINYNWDLPCPVKPTRAVTESGINMIQMIGRSYHQQALVALNTIKLV